MIKPDFIFKEDLTFEDKAIRIFEFQREHNPAYQRFCEALEIGEVHDLDQIPLLPIKAFKDSDIITAKDHSEFKIEDLEFFQSSGTSGMVRSRHYLMDPEIYRQSIIRGMQYFYDLDDFVIWAYTPGYSSNPNSSLIWMLNMLIERDGSGLSRFLELNKPLDESEVQKATESGKKLMLFGAAFGLLDLVEMKETELPDESIVMETGGMKTHRREMSREELHRRLANGFGIPMSNIHSEYGMTELLSQAYNPGGYWFGTPPWMKVTIRNPKNPMEEVKIGEEGLIGVMDLANLYSCSFILTGDKGIQVGGGKFQVLGRWNPQNLRGCNFLIDRD
ncbi:hypothetical protein [Gracilimonas tropica]|uniref:LuxE/PaaK family acyltransferase n=1 Tax=Gracilimonas tropica TaxID=454600 RepID=UPI000362A22A|nr:hypothetical protein [Gracilimonas tropica]